MQVEVDGSGAVVIIIVIYIFEKERERERERARESVSLAQKHPGHRPRSSPPPGKTRTSWPKAARWPKAGAPTAHRSLPAAFVAAVGSPRALRLAPRRPVPPRWLCASLQKTENKTCCGMLLDSEPEYGLVLLTSSVPNESMESLHLADRSISKIIDSSRATPCPACSPAGPCRQTGEAAGQHGPGP